MLMFVLAVFVLTAIPVFMHMVLIGLFVWCFTFAFVALVVWAMGAIRYEIEGDKLHVTLGLHAYESVDIADIVSVERSYNPVATAAYSLKRLRIGLRRRKGLLPFMLVSPVREEEFVAELKAVNPDIEVLVPPLAKGWWRIWDWDV